MPLLRIHHRSDGSSTGSVGVGAGAGDWRAHATDEDFVLESWSEGFMVGALIIMACITIANMRRKVLLHKLILLEQLLAMSHGTFCFMAFRGYGWYLSATAALLYCSWFIHNLVAWMKIKPFIVDTGSLFSPKAGKWTRYVYMGTLFCTIPPIVLQIYDNFRFFNNLDDFYTRVRPYEPLFRDPWWVFTCLVLFHVVQKCYGTGVVELIRRSPRFGILLAAITLSLIFTALDIASSIHDFLGTTDGINPWWKLSLVCKCLTDTIMLDDFKTELKRLGIKRIRKDENHRQSFALVLEDKDTDENGELEFAHDALNVSPEKLAEGRKRKMQRMRFLGSVGGAAAGEGESGGAGAGVGAMGRLREESVVVDESLQQQRRRQADGEKREAVGKGGRKIGPLPGLGGVAKRWRGFAGLRKGQNTAGDGEGGGGGNDSSTRWKRPWDLERDAPDVVRCEPEQQDPLTRARTWERSSGGRPRTKDTIDDDVDMSPERIARSKMGDRGGTEGAAGVGGERGLSQGAGSPDFDSIDFQTRPAGL